MFGFLSKVDLLRGNIDVFVYGTLKPGETYHRQYCAPYLKRAQPALVQGVLYDLPGVGYPTMTFGEGWVKGYVLTLDAIALSGLDYLEGYSPPGDGDPHGGEDDVTEDYTRQRTTVFNLARQPIAEAWIYVMEQPPPGAVWLSQGEWISKG